MRDGEQAIVCRRCREQVPVAGGNCPHCGAAIRRRWPLVATILVGLVLVVAALVGPSELLFFGAGGLLGGSIAGYLLYDQRERIREASESEDRVLGESEGR